MRRTFTHEVGGELKRCRIVAFLLSKVKGTFTVQEVTEIVFPTGEGIDSGGSGDTKQNEGKCWARTSQKL